ncbi:unnamed protein product [Pichia kudriavzevii]
MESINGCSTVKSEARVDNDQDSESTIHITKAQELKHSLIVRKELLRLIKKERSEADHVFHELKRGNVVAADFTEDQIRAFDSIPQVMNNLKNIIERR